MTLADSNTGSTVSFGVFTDNGDGSYTATVTSGSAAGNSAISVTISNGAASTVVGPVNDQFTSVNTGGGSGNDISLVLLALLALVGLRRRRSVPQAF